MFLDSSVRGRIETLRTKGELHCSRVCSCFSLLAKTFHFTCCSSNLRLEKERKQFGSENFAFPGPRYVILQTSLLQHAKKTNHSRIVHNRPYTRRVTKMLFYVSKQRLFPILRAGKDQIIVWSFVFDQYKWLIRETGLRAFRDGKLHQLISSNFVESFELHPSWLETVSNLFIYCTKVLCLSWDQFFNLVMDKLRTTSFKVTIPESSQSHPCKPNLPSKKSKHTWLCTQQWFRLCYWTVFLSDPFEARSHNYRSSRSCDFEVDCPPWSSCPDSPASASSSNSACGSCASSASPLPRCPSPPRCWQHWSDSCFAHSCPAYRCPRCWSARLCKSRASRNGSSEIFPGRGSEAASSPGTVKISLDTSFLN